MKITFACTGCGRRLKARPDSVGRTRKCPVCATRVACPSSARSARPAGPIYDAEIVDAEVVPAARPAAFAPKPVPARPVAVASKPVPARPVAVASKPAPARPAATTAFDPFDDADDDPYQLAGPNPASEPANEAKKPCPMCGETILASAVKCRFCGEVFDATLKKVKSKKRRKSSGHGASPGGLRDLAIGIVCMGLGIGLTVATFAAASGDEKGGGRFVVFYGLVIGGFAQTCRGIYGLIRGE